jgi:putative ATP-dependent endonuclease of OLD family
LLCRGRQDHVYTSSRSAIFSALDQNRLKLSQTILSVLVGPNNSGKSCILRAYEVVMEHGSTEGELTMNDFPKGR